MKTNTVYKRTFNRCLALLADRPLGEWLCSEAELGQELNVSRTTIRAVLSSLADSGIVAKRGTRRCLLRHPALEDYFPDPQTETVAELVERRFMEWVLKGDCRPGQAVNASELARQFGASTTAIREYLTYFAHFGLLERHPNSSWVFKGVTPEFAAEIYEIREMFELRSARRFAKLPDHDLSWALLDEIEQEHHILLAEIDQRFSDFSRLDERLHRLIHDASCNRFMREFYDVISIVFHYHYQWNKVDEKERNIVAIHEHFAYIQALQSRDVRLIEAKCRTHLRTARATLLRATSDGSVGADRGEL